MPFRSILFGVLLVALGVLSFQKPEILGAGEAGQKTALIPAYFGAALILCGIVAALGAGLRKHFMHIAAMVGLLGALGGVYPAYKADFAFSKASAVAGLLMTTISIVFLIMCIQSFIAARKAREAAATISSPGEKI